MKRARTKSIRITLALVLAGITFGAGAGAGPASALGPDPSFGDGGRTDLSGLRFFSTKGPLEMAVSDEGIYLTTIQGTISKLSSDGVIDYSFGNHENGVGLTAPFSPFIRGNLNAPVLETPADGKVLVAGGWTSRPFVSRLTTNGKFDQTFGDRGAVMNRKDFFPGPTEAFTDVAVTRDGRIYGSAVQWRKIKGKWVDWSVVRRYLPDGRPDKSFGKRGVALFKGPRNTGVYFSDLELSKGGRIIVLHSSSRGTAAMALNSRGKVIRNFAGGRGALRVPFAFKLDSSSSGRITAFGVSSGGGKIVKGGCARLYAFNWAGVRSRGFSKDGIRLLCTEKYDSMFPSFNYRPKGIYQSAFGVQGNGKPVVALGLTGRDAGGGQFGDGFTTRLRADGSLDRTFANRGLFKTATPSGLISVEGLEDGVLLTAGDNEFLVGPESFVYRFDG